MEKCVINVMKKIKFGMNLYVYISILIRSNKMQQYAGVYLLQNYSTCFGCLSHPSSGVHQTVTAASDTGHITCQSNNLPPAWLGHAGGRLLLWHVIWPVPEAAVTVLCTPDDGCDWHPKQVDSVFAVNKYLHTVASCWILLTFRRLTSPTVDVPHR